MESSKKHYPVSASDYKLLEEIGYGRNATVHRALCLPLSLTVSIKRIDLEKCAGNLDDVRREAQILSLIDHPNVVAALATFIAGHHLWVVTRYMAAGSCLTVMRLAAPRGLDEPLVATVVRECLRALDYLHFHGYIHRDVKAGNILVDDNGDIKLADFGVSACLFDCYNRQSVGRRTTFVGTPCWMAPEVLDPVCGYDCSADIWSLGITALELAQGRAPLSELPAMKMVLVQLSSPPPELAAERSRHFSRSFRDFVGCCLQKEAGKRMTAGKLLKHQFLKHGRSAEYVVEHLLRGLPPLWEQVRELRSRDVAALAMEKGGGEEEERRVSEWDFCVGDTSATLGNTEGQSSSSAPGGSSSTSGKGSSLTSGNDPSSTSGDKGEDSSSTLEQEKGGSSSSSKGMEES